MEENCGAFRYICPKGIIPRRRKSLANERTVTGAVWPANNPTAEATAVAAMEKRVTILRDLLPDSGAYINEVCILAVFDRGSLIM
jgi:hypothetical protein